MSQKEGHRIQACWNKGTTVINGWLGIPNAFSAEIVARSAGYDSVTIDMQHGLIDLNDAIAMLQSTSGLGIDVLVRVPWLEPGIIMKVLDAGARGIICPMINSSEEAANLVKYAYYPPKGERSFGPIRAGLVEDNYVKNANQTVICFAMVETQKAMDDLDAIVATEGLNGVYVGPADLAISYGLSAGGDRSEPEMISRIKTIMSSAQKAGKRAGLHTNSSEYAAKAAGWGFDLVTVLTDSRLLAKAAQEAVSKTRELIGGKDAVSESAGKNKDTGY